MASFGKFKKRCAFRRGPNVPHVGKGPVQIVAALINPIGPERGNETVTLLNTSPERVNLEQWVLADNAGQQSLDFTLDGGEARRVTMSNSIQLSNSRDTITLLGTQGAIVDQVSYESTDLLVEGYTHVF